MWAQALTPPLVSELVTSDVRNSRTEVRATRVEEPLQIDGRLDESVYAIVQPVSGFIQQLPDEGEPSSERTEVWLFFDNENIYI